MGTEIFDCEIVEPKFGGFALHSLEREEHEYKLGDNLTGEIIRLIVDEKKHRRHLRHYRQHIVWDELQTAAALKFGNEAAYLLWMHAKHHGNEIAANPMASLQLHRPTVELKAWTEERSKLQKYIKILEHHLSYDRPYLQLYRLGSWSLFASLISLLSAKLVGVGIPFNPIFALTVIPASLAVIAMAFLIKPKKETGAQRRLAGVGA